MMRTLKNFMLIGLFPVLFLTSCLSAATIRIQNSFPDASIENVKFGDYDVLPAVRPGELMTRDLIESTEGDFPQTRQLEFDLVRNDERIHVKTKQEFSLEAGTELHIILDDSTELDNGY